MSYEKVYQSLVERSVKSVNKINKDFFYINYLVIPNEECLDEFKKMNELLKSKNSNQNLSKNKQEFLNKYYREIGITKVKAEEYARNDFAIINSLSNIFCNF